MQTIIDSIKEMFPDLSQDPSSIQNMWIEMLEKAKFNNDEKIIITDALELYFDKILKKDKGEIAKMSNKDIEKRVKSLQNYKSILNKL